MKKKLEAELISIAHRILKLKNKSDIIQLHQETQKLYEKLSVLRFVEEQLGDVKPTIGQNELEDKIVAAFKAVSERNDVAEDSEVTKETKEVVAEPIVESKEAEAEPVTDEPVVAAEEVKAETVAEEQPQEATETEPESEPIADPEQPETVSEVTAATEEEPVAEYDQPAETAWEEAAHETETAAEAEPEVGSETTEEPKAEEPMFKPAFELSFDPKAEEVKEDAKDQFKNANTQITFEDILGSSYVDPVFVKPEDLEKEREAKQTENVIPISRNFGNAPVISINKEDRGYTLNDRLSKGITIGLNDRVAFMKHLFANSSEDYNRVLSQLMTFDSFDEAKSFIDSMVKPDYNNWEGKEEYADRFMEIVEKRFS